MRDLGVSEIGVFRIRPNAQYHSIGPSAAYGLSGGGLGGGGLRGGLGGGLGGGLHGGEGGGGGATWYPTLCIGLGQQGRSCFSIAVATKRPS